MKVLLALNLEALEDYITNLENVQVAGIAKDRASVPAMCRSHAPDIVFISDYLYGADNMRDILTRITADSIHAPRIAFICSEAEDEFIDFLHTQGIKDYFIGRQITSEDIEELLYRPALRRCGIGRINNIRRKTTKTVVLKELDKAVITFYSNHSTGKSHTAWNMAYCFAERGYKVCLLNLDRGFSANLYYGIEEQFQELLESAVDHGSYGSIPDCCYKRKNLNVITGRRGSEMVLQGEQYTQLLYNIRPKSDILLIDTMTGMDENTRISQRHSTLDIMVFDSDLHHFHMNMKMLDEMDEDFIPEKTIAVINNSDIRSSSYRFIYNEIKRLGLPFKGIVPLSTCGSLSSDLMYSGKVPCQIKSEESEEYRRDIDALMELLNSRGREKGVLHKILRE